MCYCCRAHVSCTTPFFILCNLCLCAMASDNLWPRHMTSYRLPMPQTLPEVFYLMQPVVKPHSFVGPALAPHGLNWACGL